MVKEDAWLTNQLVSEGAGLSIASVESMFSHGSCSDPTVLYGGSMANGSVSGALRAREVQWSRPMLGSEDW